ncbi:LysE family transporter [Microvirga tunisiensis]|uniref:LysE family transporter n=2 Tax=Pannonibacter tanglangensis TaxID=2750084 RepID=A0A7X5F338_9HYPH|nr:MULTISPECIES: LysE family transporter [unclassified Pannonibacter]NBN64355.1 LysE family transporter [Pannonibacter sp. XCT-34]NBN78890.1 LysE family transporter [Pannonibacter sp. XCT-53]
MTTHLAYAVIGLFIGLLTSAPVGPVNIMVLRRAFRGGFLGAFLTGMGAVVADSIFAAAAIFGVSTVGDFMEGNRHMLQIVGAVVLAIFGIVLLRSHTHVDRGPQAPLDHTVLRDMLAAFAMAITNPGAVLGFLAIFGGLGSWAPAHEDLTGTLVMLAGVVAGACLWWGLIAGGVAALRDRLTDRWLDGVNRIAGLALLAFAGVIGVNCLREYIP